MSNWIDEAIRAELRKDMLRAAERRHLVVQALAARRRPAIYSLALVRLGRRLETWGRSLQVRYGALAEGGVVAPAGE